MSSSPNTAPWNPSPMSSRIRIKSSQKVKLVVDVFGTGIVNSLDTLPAKVIVVGLAYAVGWMMAMIAVRIFGNQGMPWVINGLMLGCLTALCLLYILILLKPHDQDYITIKYWAYLIMLVAALAALVGLHLIIEDHDLRPLSVPLLMISLGQLGLMVYWYVFMQINAVYLWRDLLLFFAMGGSGFLMLAHMGLLTPLRNQITSYLQANSWVLWKDD
jgi:hypothetical protein